MRTETQTIRGLSRSRGLDTWGHCCVLCGDPQPLTHADTSQGKLLGTAALIIERKFIHGCSKVGCAQAADGAFCLPVSRLVGVALLGHVQMACCPRPVMHPLCPRSNIY